MSGEAVLAKRDLDATQGVRLNPDGTPDPEFAASIWYSRGAGVISAVLALPDRSADVAVEMLKELADSHQPFP